MTGLTITAPASAGELAVAPSYTPILNYYNNAGPDYSAWSRNFNMHFGYCKYLTDIFFPEKMLYRMNDEVLDRLQLPPGKIIHIADLGCGVGTVARHTANKYPMAKITGTSIVDSQVEKGKIFIAHDGLEDRVQLLKDNFEHSDLSTGRFDFAYALESACHASGDKKKLFIAEMARVLKTGGRFCIADGFLKHDKELPWLFRKVYHKILNCWALPSFADISGFSAALKKHGFKEIRIEEISLRIAPSVAYVPWTCIKFVAKEFWKNKSFRLKKERWNNVTVSLLGMILGSHRKHFGYYIISGIK